MCVCGVMGLGRFVRSARKCVLNKQRIGLWPSVPAHFAGRDGALVTVKPVPDLVGEVPGKELLPLLKIR